MDQLKDRLRHWWKSRTPLERRWLQFFFPFSSGTLALALGLGWLLPEQGWRCPPPFESSVFTTTELLMLGRAVLVGLVILAYTVYRLVAPALEELHASPEPAPFPLLRSFTVNGPLSRLFFGVSIFVLLVSAQLFGSYFQALMFNFLMDGGLLLWGLLVHWGNPEVTPDAVKLVGVAASKAAKRGGVAFAAVVGSAILHDIMDKVYGWKVHKLEGEIKVKGMETELKGKEMELKGKEMDLERAKAERSAAEYNYKLERERRRFADASDRSRSGRWPWSS